MAELTPGSFPAPPRRPRGRSNVSSPPVPDQKQTVEATVLRGALDHIERLARTFAHPETILAAVAEGRRDADRAADAPVPSGADALREALEEPVLERMLAEVLQPWAGARCNVDALSFSIADAVRGHLAPAVASSGAEGGERPPVTVICGSTRFLDEIADAERRLTAAGHVVIGLGPVDCDDATPEHEAVHRRKIDVADGIYVVNPGGYVGESTAREIAYARETGKSVAQLHPEPGPTPDDDGQAYLDYEIDREADRLLEEETRAEVRAAFPPEEAPDAR